MGKGIIDWVGQFRALRKDGYHGALSLETHWRGAGTAEEASRGSMRGMKELLAKADTWAAAQTRGGGRRGARARAASAPSGPGAGVMGANDRVRIGMIGAGHRGQDLMGQLLKVPDT